MTIDDDNPSTINDLTVSFFAKILNVNNNKENNLEIVSIQPVEAGVLSQVLCVTLKIKSTTTTTTTTEKKDDTIMLIVKLCRPDLNNLKWMFTVEGNFYTNYAKQNYSNNNCIFGIPESLFCSKNCIVLQGIQNCDTYSLLDGCPKEYMEYCITALAQFHARGWNYNNNNYTPNNNNDNDTNDATTVVLSVPPGIGHRLHPLKKEHLFVTDWKMFLDKLQLNDKATTTTTTTTTNQATNNNNNKLGLDYSACHELLSTMSKRKLRDIHNQVVAASNLQQQQQQQSLSSPPELVTLIHGDFHIANWLFPKDKNIKPHLIDWATCGFGNPMVDLVFFLVVGCNITDGNNYQYWFDLYYKHLTKYLMEKSSKNTTQQQQYQVPTKDTCWKWFQICSINLLMLLVAYDDMCRNIAISAPTIELQTMQLQHFERVNCRALQLILSLNNNNNNWKEYLPIEITQAEMEQAKQVSETIPLTL